MTLTADRSLAQQGSPAIVMLAFMVIMVDGFDLQSMGFVAPELAREWGVSLAAFAPTFSAALFGSILGALIAGPVARRLGLPFTLVLALLIFGGCTLLLVTLPEGQLGRLVAVRLVAGVGLGAAVPVAMSVVTEHSPRRFRATLITLALCGQPIGAIGGAMLCAHFIPLYGWAFAFYLGGLAPLMLSIAALLLVNRRRAVRVPAARGIAIEGRASQAGQVLESRGRFGDLFGKDWGTTTLLLAASVFCANFFLYLVINWLPGSVRSTGYSLQQSVWAISAFNAGGILGSLLVAASSDRRGALRVLPPLFSLAAVSLALLDVSQSSWPLLLAVTFVCGLLGYGSAVNLGPLAISLYPETLRTVGTGCVLGLGRVGGATGPLLAGAVLGTPPRIGRLFYGAALAAALIVLALKLLARLRRASASEALVAPES
jgi:AAHS family 4-hydroxybenzoate transporter-like MFS transporter